MITKTIECPICSHKVSRTSTLETSPGVRVCRSHESIPSCRLHGRTFTRTLIEKAVLKFYFQHLRVPAKISKLPDASEYFGWPSGTFSWNALDNQLHLGFCGYPKGYSLHNLCIKLEVAKPHPDFTIETLQKAVQEFYRLTNKKPTQTSGDASRCFGLPKGSITWMAVERRFQKGLCGFPRYFSLSKFVRIMQKIDLVP